VSTTIVASESLPDNVPKDRVVDFDIYKPMAPGQDLHTAWKALQDSSQHTMVWTPHNGGHWIALRARVIETVLSDHERFSSYTVLVPKETSGAAYRFYPLSLDPPRHWAYRRLLNENLMPKSIQPIEGKIRAMTVSLIEGFRPKGRCNFIREFSEILPLRVFMEIVDLPLEDLPRLKYLADQFTRPDGSIELPDVTRLFREYLAPVIEARRGTARTDMISRIIHGGIDGRPTTDEEASNLAIQVLVGGLDTVLNFMGFLMVFLAENPDFRHRLRADKSLIPDAVMELLRRFPIVADAREVRLDQEFEGVHLKQGDMVLSPTVLHGLDETEYANPLEVQIGRKAPHHTSFGKGVHICPGQYLARLELRVLLEEWLDRIPDFWLEPGVEVAYAGGIDLTVKPYVLVWDPALVEQL
jgi:camphor 5-monooxygenase